MQSSRPVAPAWEPRGMEDDMKLLYPARALMLPLLFAALLLAACAAREEDGSREEGMTLSVDVREVHRCSRISPEITVAYAPRGTKFYDVRLIEYGEEERFFGGELAPVPSRAENFAPDLAALEQAIDAKTRVVLINSPHNPTGAVYSRSDLTALARLLENKSQQYGRPIWLLADEPYRFLAYDGAEVPSVLPLYPYAVAVSSLSKNLSLPGERVGYVALAPHMPEKAELMAALTFTNRILGFVNPPVIGQHIMAAALGSSVDRSVYAARRAAMAQVLTEAGYAFVMPRGAFYFFPKAPGGDDVAFVNRLMEERVLAVPGSGFGWPGHFRLAFCVDESVIRNAAPGFARAMAAM